MIAEDGPILQFDRIQLTRGDFSLKADLAIASGVITAVLGPSGSGKSTLLSVAAGFMRQDAGKIVVDGVDVSFATPADRPVSVLFQDGNLFPHLNVATNIALGVSNGVRIRREIEDAVEHVLGQVGLSGYGSRLPAELSGGQQSRVALARALLRKRPVVLLDEPFAALGPALRAEMLDLVVDVFHGSTVLVVTHAPEDAQRVAAQTVFVEEGFAHVPKDTPDLFANPPSGLQDYLG